MAAPDHLASHAFDPFAGVPLVHPLKKARLGKTAAQTLDDLRNAVAEALPRFTAIERATRFTPANYEPE